MKTHSAAKTMLFALCGLIITAGAASAQNLIDLRFDSSNPDNLAGNPLVTSVTPWTNGSEQASFVWTNPTPDFNNGYAGLTVPHGEFGYRWGFQGGFTLGGTDAVEVSSIQFDYQVNGHDGEGTLTLGIGASWTGAAPLPSTAYDYHSIFANPGAGSPAQGRVTFDFANDLLTVSRQGVASYTAPLTSSLSLLPGFYGIDIITANNRFASGAWDVNVNSVQNLLNDGYYRIDNFVITLPAAAPNLTPVPTLSQWGLIILSGLMVLGTFVVLRRNKG
jgi:IPTL-CTERM motif